MFFKFLTVLSFIALSYYGVYISNIRTVLPQAFDGNEMTIDYHIVVNSIENDQQLISAIINDTFREIDRIYNNWNPNSEVSKINRLKAYEIISISPELDYFLHLTERIVKLTEGRFDPTIAPLHEIWKNHLQRGETASQGEIDNILPAVGWHHLYLKEGKIFKDHSKTSLDLGGIAKGYCVDLLVERIVKAGFNDVLVEWGGEIRAHGRHSTQRPWNIFVGRLNDIKPQNAIAKITLENQSVATSGDYIQNWSIKQNGVETIYFHIIDPRTGKPLESTLSSIASATVMAPTCLLADALAKGAMIHASLPEAREWANELSGQDSNLKFWLFTREEEM